LDFENRIRHVLKIRANHNSVNHDLVKAALVREFTSKSKTSKRKFMKLTPIIAVISVFIAVTGVSFAAGENPLSIVVSFVHNIGHDKAFGSGYSFEGGLFSDQGAAKQSDFNGYEKGIEQLLGTDSYPRLPDNIVTNHVTVNVVNQKEQLYYLQASGFIAGRKQQSIMLDIYHNVDKTINFTGQTTDDIQHDVDLSGIQAKYVEFLNHNSPGNNINYITWKNGQWTVVLHSINMSESDLTKFAHQVNIH
jgi:hypothetical protein